MLFFQVLKDRSAARNLISDISKNRIKLKRISSLGDKVTTELGAKFRLTSVLS